MKKYNQTMTKAQERKFDAYNRATATDLWQVYGSFSKAKAEAMNYCRQRQYELGGFDGRICSANSFQFTFGFQYKDADGDICLCYITKAGEDRFLLA